MLLTFILGLAAGWGVHFAEPHVKAVLTKALGDAVSDMEPVELRSIALVGALFAAAVLSWGFGSSYAVPLMLGALIGVLGPRLRERLRAARAPDYDS